MCVCVCVCVCGVCVLTSILYDCVQAIVINLTAP